MEMEMEKGSAAWIELHQLLVLLLWGFWLGQWRMEKDLCHLVPAAGPAGHFYYPIWSWAMDNGANGGSH